MIEFRVFVSLSLWEYSIIDSTPINQKTIVRLEISWFLFRKKMYCILSIFCVCHNFLHVCETILTILTRIVYEIINFKFRRKKSVNALASGCYIFGQRNTILNDFFVRNKVLVSLAMVRQVLRTSGNSSNDIPLFFFFFFLNENIK